MIRTCSTHRRRPRQGQSPRGFTLVELLVVIVILAILIALLLPAINAAMRTAKNAAVGAEINQLASGPGRRSRPSTAIYPPSRIYLAEDGDFGRRAPATRDRSPATSPMRSLRPRTVAALRKLFPRATLSTSGIVWPRNWQHLVRLQRQRRAYRIGHPSLHPPGARVPGLLPGRDSAHRRTAAAGGDRVRQGPDESVREQHTAAPATGNRSSRSSSSRPTGSVLDPHPISTYGSWSGTAPGISTRWATPRLSGCPTSRSTSTRISVSYGNGGYDPNDVNFATEAGCQRLGCPAGVSRRLPDSAGLTAPIRPCRRRPIPYTSTITAPFNGRLPAPTFLNPQSFQIISSGTRRSLRRGRPVFSRQHGGVAAAGSIDPQSVRQHDGRKHPDPRAGQRHQFP